MRITITETSTRARDLDPDDVAQALRLTRDELAALPAHELLSRIQLCSGLPAPFTATGYSKTTTLDHQPTPPALTTTMGQVLDYLAEPRHPDAPDALVDRDRLRCPAYRNDTIHLEASADAAATHGDYRDHDEQAATIHEQHSTLLGTILDALDHA